MDLFRFNPALFQQPVSVSLDAETGHVVVKLDRQAWGLEDQPIQLNGAPFQPKDELHITIVSWEAAEQVAKWITEHPGRAEDVQRLVDTADWSYRRMDKFYHVKEAEGVESLIQIVEVPRLEAFYRQLEDLIVMKLEVPPAHVTLYVSGNTQGIGIPTQEAFERLVQGEFRPEQVQAG